MVVQEQSQAKVDRIIAELKRDGAYGEVRLIFVAGRLERIITSISEKA